MGSSTIPPSLFAVGDIVLVKNTNTAYITEIYGEVNDKFFNVHYINENRNKSNVIQYRY